MRLEPRAFAAPVIRTTELELDLRLEAAGADELAEMQVFYVNVGGVLLQTFVVSRVVKWFKLPAAFLFLPVLALANAFVFAFVAWDFAGWIYHLIGHRTRIGWACHSAHHSGSEFNGSLALRQSWTPVHGLLHQPLLGVGFVDAVPARFLR